MCDIYKYVLVLEERDLNSALDSHVTFVVNVGKEHMRKFKLFLLIDRDYMIYYQTGRVLRVKEDINNYTGATSINQVYSKKSEWLLIVPIASLHLIYDFEMLGFLFLHSSQTITNCYKKRGKEMVPC